MAAYYNEIDPAAAAWLRELIARGYIADGVVDERSIEDIAPNELAGFTQHHFFAGIGGWSYALRLAGWPDDKPVWTGSCPCQPFSAAGQGAGFADERHLWPAFQHLIAQCRPPVVFGEQVASKGADAWIDLVHADLEGMGYAFGCVPFPSAGIGAPHIRDRSYWVGVGLADANHKGLEGRRVPAQRAAERFAGPRGVAGGLADADGGNPGAEREQRGWEQRLLAQDGGAVGLADPDCGKQFGESIIQRALVYRHDAGRAEGGGELEPCGDLRRVADASRGGRREERPHAGRFIGGNRAEGFTAGLEHGGINLRPGPVNGTWHDADWLLCTDGKWRPVEPSTQPLAHGIPARVGRLRGYGNAINAEAAKAFIQAFTAEEVNANMEAA